MTSAWHSARLAGPLVHTFLWGLPGERAAPASLWGTARAVTAATAVTRTTAAGLRGSEDRRSSESRLTKLVSAREPVEYRRGWGVCIARASKCPKCAVHSTGAELLVLPESGPDLSRHGTHFLVVVVPLPGPEETAEAVLEATRDHVDMQVGDALADLVVHGDERA